MKRLIALVASCCGLATSLPAQSATPQPKPDEPKRQVECDCDWFSRAYRGAGEGLLELYARAGLAPRHPRFDMKILPPELDEQEVLGPPPPSHTNPPPVQPSCPHCGHHLNR